VVTPADLLLRIPAVPQTAAFGLVWRRHGPYIDRGGGNTMRVAIGGYLVAVNTFATQRIGVERFQRAMMSGDAVLRLGAGDNAIAGFMTAARENNWQICPLNFVFPGIAGKITDEAHEWAKRTFLDSLREAPL
jgi:microcystin degradation protein MlrC